MFVLPQENDILDGKGGHTNHHLGNVRYRKIVRHFQTIFELKNCKAPEKRMLAIAIAATLREIFGSRFIGINSKTRNPFVKDNGATIRKIMQCFREQAKGFTIATRDPQDEKRVSAEAIQVTRIILSRQYPEIYKTLQKKYGGECQKGDKAKKETVTITVEAAVPEQQPIAARDDEPHPIDDLSCCIQSFPLEHNEYIPEAAPWVDRLIEVPNENDTRPREPSVTVDVQF